MLTQQWFLQPRKSKAPIRARHSSSISAPSSRACTRTSRSCAPRKHKNTNAMGIALSSPTTAVNSYHQLRAKSINGDLVNFAVLKNKVGATRHLAGDPPLGRPPGAPPGAPPPPLWPPPPPLSTASPPPPPAGRAGLQCGQQMRPDSAKLQGVCAAQRQVQGPGAGHPGLPLQPIRVPGAGLC